MIYSISSARQSIVKLKIPVTQKQNTQSRLNSSEDTKSKSNVSFGNEALVDCLVIGGYFLGMFLVAAYFVGKGLLSIGNNGFGGRGWWG